MEKELTTLTNGFALFIYLFYSLCVTVPVFKNTYLSPLAIVRPNPSVQHFNPCCTVCFTCPESQCVAVFITVNFAVVSCVDSIVHSVLPTVAASVMQYFSC